MAIDPKLVSIKTASEMPTGNPTNAGQFFFFEGNQMKKSPMTDIYDKVTSGIKGVAITSTVPSATGFERYLVHTAGTYTNFGGIVVTAADLDIVNGVANNRVFLEVNNGVSTKIVERVKGDKGDPSKLVTWTATAFTSGSTVFKDGNIWNASADTTSTDVPGVDAVWVNVGNNGLDYFLSNPTPIYLGASSIGIIKQDNTITFDGSNLAILNIPTNGASKLYTKLIRYKTISANLATYCSILGKKKSDGTYAVILPATTATTLPTEVFVLDVSEYTSISICWNNTYNPTFTFYFKNTDNNAVKKYIDGKYNALYNRETAINKTGNSIVLDLKQSKNYKIKVSDSATKVDILNIDHSDYVNMFVEVNTIAPVFNFNGNVKWANGQNPTYSLGKSYYIVLNTYDGGYSWIATVIGEWETETGVLFSLDRFSRDNGAWTADELGNVFTTSASDTFNILEKKLVIGNKATTYPFAFVDCGSAKFYCEIKLAVEDVYKVRLACCFRNSNADYLMFGFSNTNNASIYAVIGGNTVLIRDSISYTPTSDVRIGVKKIGSSLTFYINGRSVHTFTDSNYLNYVGGGFVFRRSANPDSLRGGVGEFKMIKL